MANFAHELFLLSINLTQFKSKVLITKVFVESINSIFSGHNFSWSEEFFENAEKGLKVCTRSKTYGYISFSNQPAFTEETFSLLQNAVQWLAILFEKLEQETLLNNQKEHLNSLVEKKTEDLVCAKEKASSSLQQIKVIQANTPNIIWKWDFDKDGNFTNIYISEIADEFLALPEGSIDNSLDKFFSYILPEYLPLVDDAIKNAIKNPNTLTFIEYEVKKADGKLAWFSSSGKVIPDNQKSTIYGSTIDITEKKQNEQKLVLSDTVFNLTLDMFCIAGFDGYYKYLNPAWERTLGWTIEELLSKPWLDFVHPDDAKYTENIKSVIVDGKEIYTFENRYICKDGSIKWLSWNSQPFPKENIMIGAARDITERKLDEEAFHNSQEMLVSSQSLANICSYSTNLLVSDIDKSQWVCSPEFYKIFGIDETYPHTIEGWIGFLHPDYREDVVAYHESVVLEKKSFNLEYKIIRINDGEERWVHGTGQLVYDKKGNPIRMHGAIQDITERKEVELALKESENKFKTLFKDNNSIQLLIAPSTGNIIDANQAACDFYGYDYEELTALSIQDINQYSEEEVKREMNSAKEKKKNYFEFSHKLKDGTIREVEAFSNPISIDNSQYLISIIHDVTTKKKAERELINAKEKTEESAKILKTTLQTAMDGYWVVDIKGRFLNVNDTYCKMSGFDMEELLAMRISDVEAIQSPEEINKNIQRIKKLGQLRFETKHVRKDGTLYNVEMGVQYQESNDGQFVCFIKDITERKSNEMELANYRKNLEELVSKRTRELEAKNKELDNAIKAFVGRELKIRKLEERIRSLES